MGNDLSPPRSSRKKKGAPKSDKHQTPTLEAPLSVLTKDSDVPIKDMDAWVNRTMEERQEETKKRNGVNKGPQRISPVVLHPVLEAGSL